MFSLDPKRHKIQITVRPCRCTKHEVINILLFKVHQLDVTWNTLFVNTPCYISSQFDIHINAYSRCYYLEQPAWTRRSRNLYPAWSKVELCVTIFRTPSVDRDVKPLVQSLDVLLEGLKECAQLSKRVRLSRCCGLQRFTAPKMKIGLGLSSQTVKESNATNVNFTRWNNTQLSVGANRNVM